MTIQKLQQLRGELPYKYGKILAKRIGNEKITAMTVVRVFNGFISDPELVSPIVQEAINLLNEQKSIEQKIDAAIS